MVDTRALEQSWLRVRRLAEKYPDGWEGQDLEGVDPLRVFAGAGTPRRALVVTSEPVLRRWERADWPAGLVVVVATGIVTGAQAAVLGKLASDSFVPIPFVGDADPMGLHTYLSLRGHLGAQRVRFCGICDAVLDLIGDARAQPDTLMTSVLSAFDQKHLRIVETLANPDQVLGPRVAAVLRSGKKVELEALGFRADLMIPALFNAALELTAARTSERRGRRVARSAT